MRKVGRLLMAAMAGLLLASGLVSAGSRTPLEDPPEPERVFLPYLSNWTVQQDIRISWLGYEGRLEEVCLGNYGTEAQDMAGWRLHSVVGNQWYSFPTNLTAYPQGTFAYIYSGPDAALYLPLSGLPLDPQGVTPAELVWTTGYIWDDSGDKAILYDVHGEVADEWCYGTGCP